jgi:hypothetical protein
MSDSEQPLTGLALERKFLHDICNHLAVLQGSMQIVMMKAKKNPQEFKVEDMMQRLQKGMDALDKLNKEVANRREFVIGLSEKNENPAEAVKTA